jgi:hypothetical protein
MGAVVAVAAAARHRRIQQFYLSEASYIYQRDGRRRNLKVVLIVLLVLVLIGAILLPLAVVRR